jgi:hypothetical protein
MHSNPEPETLNLHKELSTLKPIPYPLTHSHQFLLGAERGVNCDTTCEKEGLSCLSSASAYKMVNTCEALKQVPCLGLTPCAFESQASTLQPLTVHLRR